VEDIDPFWPEPEADDSGIFFTYHDVDVDLADADAWTVRIKEAID